MWPVALLLGVGTLPLGLAATIDRTDYDVWGGFIWGPVCLLLALRVVRWTIRRSGDLDLVRFFVGAAALKVVVGPLLRVAVDVAVYGDLSDAERYDSAGTLLAPTIRQGVLTDVGKVSGTHAVELFAGFVKALIGDTKVGVIFVFSLLGFCGLCCFYLASAEALPTADRRLLRYLLFLSPTLWYWPSTIGKEALMVLCLGVATLAAARMFAGRPGSLVVGLLALWGTLIVRPHLTLLFVFALGVGFIPLGGVARPAQGARRLLTMALAVVALLVALPVVVGQAEQFFHLDRLDPDTSESFLNSIVDRTSIGGSAFAPPNPRSVPGYVMSVATVLLRPFPFEAPGAPGLFAAAETMAGLGLVARYVAVRGASLRRLRHGLPRLSVAYVAAFAFVFSAVGNFGILVRQRATMLPFLALLLAALVRPPQAPLAGPDDDTSSDALSTSTPRRLGARSA